jgi:GTP-binding protein
MGNILAIVGRPNVGKSTLFNRLSESRSAIVHESSGVTRDRHYGKCIWNGVEFSVIDTGGYVINSDDIFEEEIRKQVLLAIEESDVIVFMVDVESGITDLDEEVARMLRKIKKPVFLCVNKVDNNERIYDSHIFHSFGLGELFCVSSVSGSGTGDLLDAVVKAFTKTVEDEDITSLPKFAVVGRPNVGKSSFINAILGEERNIVTPIAGTTRDTLNTHYKKYGNEFIILDTAGLRKKGKVEENIEFYSVMRSIRAIENADVSFLMIDAERGVEAQDLSIFKLIQKNNKGVVILVNKWDLVEKETNTSRDYEKEILERFQPFSDIPVIFISAETKQRVFKAIEVGMEVYHNRNQKIKTSVLNEFLLDVIENSPPPSSKGKYIRIKYVTQLPTYFPAFALFCNLPQYVKEDYKRFLENRMREHFNFSGVPIQLYFRKK